VLRWLQAHSDAVVVAEFEDVASGASADRAGLAEMFVTEGFDAVLVPAWDRLARDVMLDGWIRFNFEKRGVRVLSATQENGVDPISKLTQSILAAVAEFDRHAITQRLAGGRKAKAALGGYAHGQAPFGTKAKRGSGLLEIDPAERATLEVLHRWREGGKTLRAIAALLNCDRLRARYPSRNGGPWAVSSVYGALASYDRVLHVEALAEARRVEGSERPGPGR
jgi:DNA invertase Pin-like site-specific DNA recombinase